MGIYPREHQMTEPHNVVSNSIRPCYQSRSEALSAQCWYGRLGQGDSAFRPGRVLCWKRCGRFLRKKRQQLLRKSAVGHGHTGQDVLEGQLNIAGIKRRGFDEAEVVFARKLLGLFCGHSTQMSQIALVTD